MLRMAFGSILALSVFALTGLPAFADSPVESVFYRCKTLSQLPSGTKGLNVIEQDSFADALSAAQAHCATVGTCSQMSCSKTLRVEMKLENDPQIGHVDSATIVQALNTLRERLEVKSRTDTGIQVRTAKQRVIDASHPSKEVASGVLVRIEADVR